MLLANVLEIESVNFKGYLDKQARVKTWTWKKYWFVLEDGQLAYFQDETLVDGRGLIDLGQALSIKPAPTAPRDYSFEIATKNRNHVLCAETEQVRDQWIRLLQQGKLLRPRRTPSMNIARCNSISSDEEGLSHSSLDSLATPPLTPKSPHAPNSPKPPSPAGQFFSPTKQAKNKTATNSPKLTKNNAKSSPGPGPKFGFSSSPATKSSESVMLTGIKVLNNDLPVEPTLPSDSNKHFQQNKVETPPKRRIAHTKTQLGAMQSNKIPVSRVVTCPPQDHNHNHQNGAYRKPSSESSVASSYEQKKSPPEQIRPVSSPGQLTRGKPVSKDLKPQVNKRPTGFRQPSSTSSDESDNASSISSSSDLAKPKLERRRSGNNNQRKLPAKDSASSAGEVVLRRAVGRPTKSLPYQFSQFSDSDSETSDNVFSPQGIHQKTRSSVAESDGAVTQKSHDDCGERLSKSLSIKRPAVPNLPYPRLELTFRSAFDDVRLFLANNRSDDEIFPVPRHSERGGKAIHKLQKFISTLP